MDDVLPTYATATSKDPWSIIAPYIDTQDLCNASLVCKQWHHIFTKVLWGDPAIHFGEYSDLIYATLFQFRRAISIARPFIRTLTHTLRLPTCHADLQLGPSASWIQGLLNDLPRLQSLNASSCPFFDHASLLALSGPIVEDGNQLGLSSRGYALKMLDASKCSNATSSGLCRALTHLPHLVYLDLSFTSAAADDAVMHSCNSLVSLQLLKLRSVGLRDQHLAILSRQVRLRLRSLDIRENNLTDISIRALLLHCFPNLRSDLLERDRSNVDQSQLWDAPEDRPDATVPYHHDTRLEKYVFTRYTSDFVDQLAIEDDFDPGITHLYLDGNRFTDKGISMLLVPRWLRVLDVGMFSNAATPLSAGDPTGLADLIMAFATHKSKRLRYLRISGEVVTHSQSLPSRRPPLMSRALQRPQTEIMNGTSLSAGSSLYKSAKRTEDLPDYDAELADPSESAYSLIELPELGISRRNTMPEKVQGGHERLTRSLSNVVSTGPLQAPFGRQDDVIEQPTRLAPGMLLGLKVLVLCRLPKASTDANVSRKLCDFISEAATESRNAAKASDSAYDIPPSKNKRVAQREHAMSLFALEQIKLEIAPVTSLQREEPLKQRRRESSLTKSTTEDPDSDAFWAASENDFSFFSEEDWDQSSPRSKVMFEKQVASPSTAFPKAKVPVSAPTPVLVNTVDAIVKFRQDSRAAYLRAAGEASAHERSEGLDWWKLDVPGYWPGIITVMHHTR